MKGNRNGPFVSFPCRKLREGPSLQGAFLLIKAYALILFIRIFQIRSETFLFLGGRVGWVSRGLDDAFLEAFSFHLLPFFLGESVERLFLC